MMFKRILRDAKIPGELRPIFYWSAQAYFLKWQLRQRTLKIKGSITGILAARSRWVALGLGIQKDRRLPIVESSLRRHIRKEDFKLQSAEEHISQQILNMR